MNVEAFPSPTIGPACLGGICVVTLRPLGVLAGVAAGSLAATLVALISWPFMELVGADDPPLAGLTVGVVVGLGAAGYVAGRMAFTAFRFNGSVAALGLAGIVVVVARLGGSPADTVAVLWLALMSVAVGGVAGSLAGRRPGGKQRRSGGVG